MFLVPSISGLFKWRQFEPEVILLTVGWYLRFSLSYRDVEELLAERGLHADHVTVWRWVQRYAPKMERRLRSRLKPTNDSWRVDETYIRVKGKWRYLLPGGGFFRRHSRLPSLGQAGRGRGRGQALSCQSACRTRSPEGKKPREPDARIQALLQRPAGPGRRKSRFTRSSKASLVCPRASARTPSMYGITC